MALYDYAGALKKGRRQYQLSVSKGEYPYLPVLDDILSYTDIASEVSLGIIDVPLDKIVGTKTKGRTSALPIILCRCYLKSQNSGRNGQSFTITRLQREFRSLLWLMNL